MGGLLADLDASRRLIRAASHRAAQLQRAVAVVADLAVEDQVRAAGDAFQAGSGGPQPGERVGEEGARLGRVQVPRDGHDGALRDGAGGDVVARHVASSELRLDVRGQDPAVRRDRLDVRPVRADRLGRLAGRLRRDVRDGGQRHAQAPQQGDEPGRGHLVLAVEPVAAVRVDPGRRQQPQPVVQPQRLGGQPGPPGERADRHQVHRSPPGPGDLPGAMSLRPDPRERSSWSPRDRSRDSGSTHRDHGGGNQPGRDGTARLASFSASIASKVIQIGRSPLSQAHRAAASPP